MRRHDRSLGDGKKEAEKVSFTPDGEEVWQSQKRTVIVVSGGVVGRLDRRGGFLSRDRGSKDGRSGGEDKGGTEHCHGRGGGWKVE